MVPGDACVIARVADFGLEGGAVDAQVAFVIEHANSLDGIQEELVGIVGVAVIRRMGRFAEALFVAGRQICAGFGWLCCTADDIDTIRSRAGEIEQLVGPIELGTQQGDGGQVGFGERRQ